MDDMKYKTFMLYPKPFGAGMSWGGRPKSNGKKSRKGWDRTLGVEIGSGINS
jgi:hypothetical protein